MRKSQLHNIHLNYSCNQSNQRWWQWCVISEHMHDMHNSHVKVRGTFFSNASSFGYYEIRKNLGNILFKTRNMILEMFPNFFQFYDNLTNGFEEESSCNIPLVMHNTRKGNVIMVRGRRECSKYCVLLISVWDLRWAFDWNKMLGDERCSKAIFLLSWGTV